MAIKLLGVNDESYKGQWLWDRKHGYVEKWYANADVYQGWWRSNLQDGEGKYRWSNGVLICANGNIYEGL